MTVAEPPPPLPPPGGCQCRQEKLLPFILEEKQKQDYQRTLGENERKSEYMNALECLWRAEKKTVKKGIGKILHDLWIEKM